MTLPLANALDAAQWGFASPFLLVFATCAVINAVLFFRRYILHWVGSSLIPFIGGIAGVGFYDSPLAALRHIAWLPLFVDVGCIPWLFFSLWMVRRQKRRIGGGR